MTEHLYTIRTGDVVERFDMRIEHYAKLAERRAKATGRTQEVHSVRLARKRAVNAMLGAS